MPEDIERQDCNLCPLRPEIISLNEAQNSPGRFWDYLEPLSIEFLLLMRIKEDFSIPSRPVN